MALTDELGYQLAELRKLYVFDRYINGAITINVPVMREFTHQLRAGSWVIVDWSWFPDYVMRRRGYLSMMQVIAIGDLDCAWREVLCEEAMPLEIGPVYS